MSGKRSSQRSLDTIRGVPTVCRRRADTVLVAQLWGVVEHIREGRQVANVERISRFMMRLHDVLERETAQLLRFAAKERLLKKYKSVPRKIKVDGSGQTAYQIPDLDTDFKVGSHDWYCFECHRGGSVVECSRCWRVYHPQCFCHSAACVRNAVFTCPVCQKERSPALKMPSKELNRYLSFVIERLKEKSEALYQLKGSVEDQLKMRFFVHHNMDLEMMELKTSSGQYKSLEQLRGDAATVFHNVMLCFTDSSDIAVMAKTMLTDCDYELAQICLCRDCYWNSNTKPDHWFSVPCSQPHELVYAKVIGYPYWPAKVMEVKSDGYDVRFFGPGHHRAVVNLPLTKPITDAPDVSDLKNGSSKTYTEAMKELKLHQQLLKPHGKSSQLQPALLTSSLEVEEEDKDVSVAGKRRRSIPKRYLTESNADVEKPAKRICCSSDVHGRTADAGPSKVGQQSLYLARRVKKLRNATLSGHKSTVRISLQVVKRGRRKGCTSKTVQASLSCSACEPLLSAQLQAVKDDQKAHLEQQLEELTNRLRSEYEIDKQQALDRVASESEQSIMHMRNSIEQAYEHQRDELTRRLEREQKDRLAAVKRLQWCAKCENEAKLYCCWSTSYCSVLCQKEHWEHEHSSQCRHKQQTVLPTLSAQNCC